MTEPAELIQAEERHQFVIDLTSSQVSLLQRALGRWIEWSSFTVEKHAIADLLEQIAASMKPERIEEPGAWGVVKARAFGVDLPARAWVRGWSDHWFFGEHNVKWEDLFEPVLIRNGIQETPS
jgi:hypothetical protein